MKPTPIPDRTTLAYLRTTLIIDPATGALNAVEEQAAGRLFAYRLFYETEWDDHHGPQTPQPTPVSTIRPARTSWPQAS